MKPKPVTAATFTAGGHHCRHCGQPRQYGLRRANHKNVERLAAEILDLLRIGLQNDWLLFDDCVTRESIALHFEVPEHQVDQAFQALKVKGYMRKGANRAPHDSTRDRWGGGDSAWMGTRYPVNREAVLGHTKVAAAPARRPRP